MMSNKVPPTFWVNWLKIASLLSMAFGLLLAFFPKFTNQGFSLLIYANTETIASFNQQAINYISLLHAVLGAVIFGWFLVIYLIVKGLFAKGVKESWALIAISLTAWFVPDTTISLLTGFWQNAVLNLVFYGAFIAPLGATLKHFTRD
jgi:hypothetical protein